MTESPTSLPPDPLPIEPGYEGLLPPPWLAVTLLACLPLMAYFAWRVARWYLRGKPLPLPVGEAMPTVPLTMPLGGALFLALFGLTWTLPVLWHLLGTMGLLPGVPNNAVFSPGLLAGQTIPPLLGLVFVRRLGGPGALAALGLRGDQPVRRAAFGIAAVAAVLPVCVAVMILSAILFALLGVPQQVHPLLEVLEVRPSPWAIVGVILQAVVLAPLAEEFLYRGVLMWPLVRGLGAAPALLVSSAVFGLVHAPAQPQAVLPLGILGAVLGYVAYRTRSLVPAVAGHAAFNALMVVGVVYGGG